MYVDETSIILPPSRFVGRMSKIYFSTNEGRTQQPLTSVSHIIKLMRFHMNANRQQRVVLLDGWERKYGAEEF